jgi:hypothetical protein
MSSHGRPKALEAVERGDDRERGQRVDPPKAAQPADRGAIRILLRRDDQLRIERAQVFVDLFEPLQVIAEHGSLQAPLPSQPLTVLRPVPYRD